MASQLRDIRAAVARHCMDWVQFFASSNSADTTVFIDEVAGYENDHHFRGSELWFRNDAGTAANRGITVRVIDSSVDLYSLTLGTGLIAAPAIGDEAWLFNIGGTGNRIRTYDATINDCIRSLGEMASSVHSEELPDVWDQDVWWVDIPEDFTHIGGVSYMDIDGQWSIVPSHGWSVNQMTAQLAISPEYAYLANTYNVRLDGLSAPVLLTDDDDTTDVDFEWLTYEAAGILLLQSRDQFKVNKGGMLKNASDAIRGKAGNMMLIPDMVKVR